MRYPRSSFNFHENEVNNRARVSRISAGVDGKKLPQLSGKIMRVLRSLAFPECQFHFCPECQLRTPRLADAPQICSHLLNCLVETSLAGPYFSFEMFTHVLFIL